MSCKAVKGSWKGQIAEAYNVPRAASFNYPTSQNAWQRSNYMANWKTIAAHRKILMSNSAKDEVIIME